MKENLIFLICFLFVSFGKTQTNPPEWWPYQSTGKDMPVIVNDISNWTSLSINTIIIPPEINIVQKSIQFFDKNLDKNFEGNNRLDALEDGYIEFEIINTGEGDGKDLEIIVKSDKKTKGIEITSPKVFDIKAGNAKTKRIHFKTTKNLDTNKYKFTITVEEPNGLGADPFDVTIETLKFLEPKLEVDYEFMTEDGSNIKKKKPFYINILVQNTGEGKAENINLNLSLPNEIMEIGGQETMYIEVLQPGETKSFKQELIVTGKYKEEDMNLDLNVNEKYSIYGTSINCYTELNQEFRKFSLVVDGDDYVTENISKQFLKADVDRNIPINATKKNKYALIIGNEDYTSKQRGLNSAGDVDFAQNDAIVFKEYVNKTLGVKKERIQLLLDATVTEMNRAINKIVGLGKLDKNAEIIFYYAGHGYPDEEKNPYLMPVDVNVDNIKEYGIPLKSLYGELNKSKAKKITIFLDACFSGGGRDESLLASRGIVISPKQDKISGNMVLFASSSGDERSLPYINKSHGIFTYFLLKHLQKTKGKTSYKECENYIKEKVQRTALIEHSLNQTPGIQYSKSIKNTWENWQLY